MQLQLCLHWKPSLPNLTKSKHMEDSDEKNSSLAILYIWAVISKWFSPEICLEWLKMNATISWKYTQSFNEWLKRWRLSRKVFLTHSR